LDRILRATLNTWNGLRAAARSEAAFREELVLLALSLPLAFVIGETAAMRLTLVLVVVLILIVELLNTAVEKLADRVTTAREPEIGRIKDMGSAAVGLSLAVAGLVWLYALCLRFGLM
jgi:diacylglycerol kinase (ATP)